MGRVGRRAMHAINACPTPAQPPVSVVRSTAPWCSTHLVGVLHLLRLEAVEGHEGDAPALAAAQLRRQRQRRVIVLHLQCEGGHRLAGWASSQERVIGSAMASDQAVECVLAVQHERRLTTTWNRLWLATTSVAVYSSLRQSNSSISVPYTCAGTAKRHG